MTTPAEAPGGVASGRLRHVLGHFVTGVTVVTTMSDDGPVGMTVNSFTSVSLDPPLVLFCAAERSSTGRRVLEAGAFAVNILGREQEDLCRRFARPVPDRFAGIEIELGPTGSPILRDALASLDCRLADHMPSGDHVIVVGRVVEAGVRRDGEPLTFYKGTLNPR